MISLLIVFSFPKAPEGGASGDGGSEVVEPMGDPLIPYGPRSAEYALLRAEAIVFKTNALVPVKLGLDCATGVASRLVLETEDVSGASTTEVLLVGSAVA
jgi:hypothetical protein